MDRFPRSDSIIQARSGLQTYMAQVYGWMTVGLLLTAFIAWFAANTPAVMMFVFSSKITFFGLIIAQLALVFVLSGMVQRLSAGMATTLFMLYSALTGLTLSSIFLVYTYSSIASTFVGQRRDVWDNEPLWLYHEARSQRFRQHAVYGLNWYCPGFAGQLLAEE
ncbi:Inner membrane protein YbhL [Raoultella planticola]|uniref:Inner membrane protein YbhL n=1 Tax=Raoultella planticola TaxID=575 RepID=A0A485B6Z0_RAOPL|nr:Inner membrane protein YbhL [Raoultella planticola]